MDEKYIWPLVGVALGWALSFFSSILKDRAERSQRIGVLVSKLLHLHEQVLSLEQLAEKFKDHAQSWQDYEFLRARVNKRHLLEPPSHLESLRESIDGISGIYPVDARSLHWLVDMLLKSKSAPLSASSKSKELYVRMLSLHEVQLHGIEQNLRRFIRAYAWHHGVSTYIRVLWELRRRDREKYKRDMEVVDRITAEIWAERSRLMGGGNGHDDATSPSGTEPSSATSDAPQ